MAVFHNMNSFRPYQFPNLMEQGMSQVDPNLVSALSQVLFQVR